MKSVLDERRRLAPRNFESSRVKHGGVDGNFPQPDLRSELLQAGPCLAQNLALDVLSRLPRSVVRPPKTVASEETDNKDAGRSSRYVDGLRGNDEALSSEGLWWPTRCRVGFRNVAEFLVLFARLWKNLGKLSSNASSPLSNAVRGVDKVAVGREGSDGVEGRLTQDEGLSRHG